MRRPAALLTLLAACGGSSPPPVIAPPTEPPDAGTAEVEDPLAGAVLRGRGTAETLEGAYAAAVLALRQRLFGDVDPGVEVHGPGDPRASCGDGCVEVGLTLEGLRRVVGSMDDSMPGSMDGSTAVPAGWGDVLGPVRRARAIAAVCAAAADACPTEDPDGDAERAEAAARARWATLTLEPVLAGGLPAHGGRILRPARLRVVSTDPETAVAGLPIAVELDGAARTFLTDAGGVAEVLPVGESVGPERFCLDLGPLLGRPASCADGTALTLSARPVDWRRLAVVAVEQSQGERAPERVGADALRQALQAAGAQLSPLPEAVRAELRRADETRRADRLPALADDAEGALDVVLTVRMESEFARRMGPTRVWYAASGQMTVWNAWSGEVLHRLRGEASANDLGDARADVAARRALGRELARRLQAAMPLPSTAVARAP
jgi:hypothetical protein